LYFFAVEVVIVVKLVYVYGYMLLGLLQAYNCVVNNGFFCVIITWVGTV